MDYLKMMCIRASSFTSVYRMLKVKNSFSKENMRISASLSTKSYIETLVNSDEKKSCTWMKMNLRP